LFTTVTNLIENSITTAYHMVVCFLVSVCSLLVPCMSTPLRVGVKTLSNTMQRTLANNNQEYWKINESARLPSFERLFDWLTHIATFIVLVCFRKIDTTNCNVELDEWFIKSFIQTETQKYTLQ